MQDIFRASKVYFYTNFLLGVSISYIIVSSWPKFGILHMQCFDFVLTVVAAKRKSYLKSNILETTRASIGYYRIWSLIYKGDFAQSLLSFIEYFFDLFLMLMDRVQKIEERY